MKQQPLANCMPVPIRKDNRWDAINHDRPPVPASQTLHKGNDDADADGRNVHGELLLTLGEKSVTSSSSAYQHSTTTARAGSHHKSKTVENPPSEERGRKPNTKLCGVLASPISHGSSTRCTAGQSPSGKKSLISSTDALREPSLFGPEDVKKNDEKKDEFQGYKIISLNDFMTKERSLRGGNLEQWFQHSDSSRSEDDSEESTHGTSMIPVI